jgi:hypothetical protein
MLNCRRQVACSGIPILSKALLRDSRARAEVRAVKGAILTLRLQKDSNGGLMVSQN